MSDRFIGPLKSLDPDEVTRAVEAYLESVKEQGALRDIAITETIDAEAGAIHVHMRGLTAEGDETLRCMKAAAGREETAEVRDQLWMCEDCGHACMEREMEVDYMPAEPVGDGDWIDEVWSNWICPGCGMWHQGLGEGEGWRRA